MEGLGGREVADRARLPERPWRRREHAQVAALRPSAEHGRRKTFTRPVINLEPPYEDHFGYQSRKPHSAYSTRRAVYWSLLNAPVCASPTRAGPQHTKPGETPTDHPAPAREAEGGGAACAGGAGGTRAEAVRVGAVDELGQPGNSSTRRRERMTPQSSSPAQRPRRRTCTFSTSPQVRRASSNCMSEVGWTTSNGSTREPVSGRMAG